MSSDRPVTLRDVARRTGYSTASVSLALHDHPRIPASTRQIIRRAAEAMGYSPDPVIAAVAARRWKRDMVPPAATLAAIRDGMFPTLVGMQARARSFAYSVEVFRVADYPDPARLASVLHARGILGVLVGQVFTAGFCEGFDWSHFAAVACGEGFHRPPVHLVTPNHFGALQHAWSVAWERGYRRIGVALFDQSEASDVRARCGALLECQRRMDEAPSIPPLFVRPWSSGRPNVALVRAAHAAMGDWVRAYRPDVVLGLNDAFRWLLRDAGWRIPQDMAFINLWINVDDPEQTGFELLHHEVGRRAVDWLDSLLRTGERGLPDHPATLQVDLRWREGPWLPRARPQTSSARCVKVRRPSA